MIKALFGNDCARDNIRIRGIKYGVPRIRETQGNTPNEYLFTGEQYDELLDGYYLRERYYLLSEASFISKDSAWTPHSAEKS